MKRSIAAPILVAFFSVAAGGWLLQQGVERAENVYVRVRVLQEVVDRVETSFVDEVDAGDLYDSAIDGLIRDLGDPHSSFMPASEFEDLRIRTEGEYGGVGLEVVQRDGYVTVVSPIPGGPGGRMGIRGGDRFYEIEGVRADTMVTDQAVELLRGRGGLGSVGEDAPSGCRGADRVPDHPGGHPAEGGTLRGDAERGDRLRAAPHLPGDV